MGSRQSPRFLIIPADYAAGTDINLLTSTEAEPILRSQSRYATLTTQQREVLTLKSSDVKFASGRVAGPANT